MAKPLNKIIKAVEYGKGAPLPGGEAKFVAKHKVEVTDDANGNDDEVFKASKIQYANRFPHHGYNHDEDHAVYEEAGNLDEASYKEIRSLINTPNHGYSKSAVDKEIGKDKRIKGKEAKAIHAILKGRQESDEPVKEEVELDESAGDAEFDAAYQQKLDAAHKGRQKQRAKAGVEPTGKDAEGAKKTAALADIFKKSREKSSDEDIVAAARAVKSQPTVAMSNPVKAPPAPPQPKTHPHSPINHDANYRHHLNAYAMSGDPAHLDHARKYAAAELAQGLQDARTFTRNPEHYHEFKRGAKNVHRQKQSEMNQIERIHNPKPGMMDRIKSGFKSVFGKKTVKEDFDFEKEVDYTDEEIKSMLIETFIDGEVVEAPKYEFFKVIEEGDVVQGKFGGAPKKVTSGSATVHNFDPAEEKKDRFFKALTGKRPTPEQKAKWAAMERKD